MTKPKQTNGDASQSQPAISAQAPPVVIDSTEGFALKAWMKLAIAGGLLLGASYFLTDRISKGDAAAVRRMDEIVEKHSKRPHTAAVSKDQHKEDLRKIEKTLDRLETKSDGQTKQLGRILEAVRK